jgi:hypothetical protein
MTDLHRVTLPDGRLATVVPADDAGEYMLSAAEGLLMHLEERQILTWRQCTAAAELARLYGIGGGRSPWRRSSGGERPDDVVAAARAEFAALLSAAPQRCQWSLTVLAMGEWPTDRDPRPLWREGLTAVADRMKLAPEAG